MIIDAALNPAEIAELPSRDLRDSVCVVFDVLRATSSIVTALAHGTREVFPVRTIDEARELRGQMSDAALAGERDGERIEGFDFGNSPLEFCGEPPARIITTTTNGTIALRACDGAGETLVAALLNLAATAAHVRAAGAERMVLVCAGTFETTALEDIFAAGALAAMFENAELTDSAICALATFVRYGPLEALLAARNGRALVAKGRRGEVEFCAEMSRFDVLCRQEGGVVRVG